MEEKLFIYKTTCLIDGNYYIGQHKGYETDDYLGSGMELKKAIKKYGEKNFKREILAYANDRIELDLLEAKFVGDKEVKDEKCFNHIPGGGYLIQYGQWSNVFKILHRDTKKMLSPTNYCFKVKKTPIDIFSCFRPGHFSPHMIKTPSGFFNEKVTNDKKFEKFLKRFFHIKNIVIDDFTFSFTEEDVPEKSKSRFHYFVKEIIHDFNSLGTTSIPGYGNTKRRKMRRKK
jgi:hypothetical protein